MYGKRTKVFFQDCGPGPEPPFFDCEAAGGDGFYAYDKNCRKYIQCSGGLPDLHTCNPGIYSFYNSKNHYILTIILYRIGTKILS